MDLANVILGPVVTEKAERLKAQNTYTLRVARSATKIDVKGALRKYYDVDVESVRVLTTAAKRRAVGAGKFMEKRHRAKHMIVRLAKKSKALDLATFKAS